MFTVYFAMSGSRENINFDQKREAQYCRGFFKVSDYNWHWACMNTVTAYLNWKKSKAEIFPRLCLICGHLFNNYLVLDSGVETVIKRSHVLERQQLDVKPYYPFLENWTTNKTDIAKFWSRSVWLCQEVPPTRITRTEGTGWIFRWRSKFYNHYFSIGEEGEKESLQSWQKRVSGLETF